MYLKSLTLKGFKSFAAPTTLRFEPGITAVVGPNGSGKSNVVDALAWVMGEQGAKTLRGGKMEDVIFAGTSSRAPLGRAEVTVSIDNSDNALPIEYTEVSITRRMFRDGASEYEINGSSCRLMDVQELLSDSGIGREMHVIVGQGKLEEILQSRPEDRRAFIEEAAGVLKHRKRKEKALRKLDTMAANLARLTDLTTELRRQLKPLGRQAEAAQRAAAIQADLRDARLRLAADDLVSRRAEREAVFQAEAAMRREHDEAAARLAVASEELAAHESAVAELSTRAESIQHTWFGLSALAERVDATVRIASERAHHLDIEPVAVSDTDPRKPEELEAEAQQVAVAEQQLLAELDAARARLDAARAELADRERRAAEADRAHLAAVREEADRREDWRGWLARGRPCGRVSNRSMRAWHGCPSGSRMPQCAPSRPEPSSKPCRAASVNWIKARSAWMSTTSVLWPRCGWPTNASPSCNPPNAPPNARWHRYGLASMRSQWGYSARTARRGWRTIAVAQGFSVRSPNW
ncbi:chromosome partition protein SMC [Mycobacterium tuberculosis]|nr:chromosome partition protein SMC [Mycobacterium tuberculosis]